MTNHFCIDFAKDFKCLGGKCPYTCCKGWQIPVDDETYARYTLIPGLRGKIYRAAIIKKEPKRIRKMPFMCPFYTRDGLCGHQKKGEEILMPLVCRNYPRRISDFGPYSEYTLELSCPEAARLFLENPGRRKFVETEFIKPLWSIENNDPGFLSFLSTEREKMLDLIWEGKPIYEIWSILYPYIRTQHEFIARDKLDEAKKVTFENADSYPAGNKTYAFFSIHIIDRMIIECIDYGALVLRVPKFYHFIKRYLKVFSKMTLAGADEFFHAKICEMISEKPELELKYRSYFSYVLQQEYMTCYESYAIVREYLFCVLYTQLLMLFDLMAYLETKGLSRERETEILYLTEHNIRHNPKLTWELFDVIRQEFF